MEELNPTLLADLRSMARRGTSPAQMLRELAPQVAQEPPLKFTLIRYLRAAFGLSLQQASPVGGWAADGSGELTDANLDTFLAPEIARNRPAWDPPSSPPLPTHSGS